MWPVYGGQNGPKSIVSVAPKAELWTPLGLFGQSHKRNSPKFAEDTTLEACSIYRISAWNLKLEGAKQQNLNVSASEEPAIMVDDLEVAHFIYLLLNNKRIRQIIDTITSGVWRFAEYGEHS